MLKAYLSCLNQIIESIKNGQTLPLQEQITNYIQVLGLTVVFILVFSVIVGLTIGLMIIIPRKSYTKFTLAYAEKYRIKVKKDVTESYHTYLEKCKKGRYLYWIVLIVVYFPLILPTYLFLVDLILAVLK